MQNKFLLFSSLQMAAPASQSLCDVKNEILYMTFSIAKESLNSRVTQYDATKWTISLVLMLPPGGNGYFLSHPINRSKRTSPSLTVLSLSAVPPSSETATERIKSSKALQNAL